ncbi:MAG: hypothetical protein Kapaf2KO_04260 [Candidatus Kapaibacteriales bacterium]
MRLENILKASKPLLLICLISLSVCDLLSLKYDLAPKNFMPDPGFQNWTPQNPLFYSDLPHATTRNQYDSYDIVYNLNEKNVNYPFCSADDKIFVSDALVLEDTDPQERFKVIEFKIDINENRKYAFFFNYLNPDYFWAELTPIISVEIDGIEIMAPTEVLNDSTNKCDFETFYDEFNSGNRDSITLTIYNNRIYKYPRTMGPTTEIRGNDLALWGFEMYEYCEMTDNDIQDISICKGNFIPSILKETYDEHRPLEVKWDFEQSGVFYGDEILNFKADFNEQVVLEITDDIGCTEFDTFNINVFEFPDNLELTSDLTEGDICPCQSGTIVAPSVVNTTLSYAWYDSDWDEIAPGSNSPILSINSSGDYKLVLQSDLGCLDTLEYSLNPIEGDISLSLMIKGQEDRVPSASLGENIDLVIKSSVSDEFVACGVDELTFSFLYNYTVLHNPDLVKEQTFPNGDALVRYTINSNDSIVIPMEVLLGITDSVELDLFDVTYGCSDFDEFYSKSDNAVKVEGICIYPDNNRQIDQTAGFSVNYLSFADDRISLEFTPIESGSHTVTVTDYTGKILLRQEIKTISEMPERLERHLSVYSNILFVNIATKTDNRTFMTRKKI